MPAGSNGVHFAGFTKATKPPMIVTKISCQQRCIYQRDPTCANTKVQTLPHPCLRVSGFRCQCLFVLWLATVAQSMNQHRQTHNADKTSDAWFDNPIKSGSSKTSFWKFWVNRMYWKISMDNEKHIVRKRCIMQQFSGTSMHCWRIWCTGSTLHMCTTCASSELCTPVE